MKPAELAYDARAQLGEGALWHEGRLLWVDIEGRSVHRFDPATGRNETWPVGQLASTVVPRQRGGGLVVTVYHGVGFLDPATGAFDIKVDPEGGRDDVRFNDGKCDPRGRLFAGTMGMTKPRKGASLFRVEPDLSFTRVLTDLGNSNGLAWSPDHRTFYHIDTPTREVSAFDYDPDTGEIANRRCAVRIAESEGGFPDGMTIDAHGNLWIALWGGAAVVCCDPRTGRVVEKIPVPASQTTSCAFGGPELRDLYITSARKDLNDEQLRQHPHAGGIFVAQPGVAGVPAFAFAG